MKFAAFMGTIDEADLVGANIRHLRSIGVDLVVVLDYGSTDGTLELLRTEEARGDVWVLNVHPAEDYDLWVDVERQIARSCGAEWALFLDSDEFWLPASGSLHDLQQLAEADILIVDRFNVASAQPGNTQLEAIRDGRLDDVMLYVRGPDAYEAGLVRLASYLDENPGEAWIRGGGREPKILVRPEAIGRLHDAHHDVDAPPGGDWRRDSAADLVIAHVPFTTLDRFGRKVSNIRTSQALHPEWFINDRGWQWSRWLRLADEGRLESEFAAQFLAREAIQELRAERAVVSVAELFTERAA